MLRRTPPPSEPWCVMGMIGYYGSARAIHVHESRIPMLQSHGWIVIARDSDHPLPDELPPGQMYYQPSTAPTRAISIHDDED